MILLVLIVMILMVTGCSSFECSIGVGYRKVPPEVASPILTKLTASELTGISPAQIDWLLKLLGSEQMKVLFPKNNRVDLGVYCEIKATK